MFKGFVDLGDDGKLITLGITAANVEIMKENRPIIVEGGEFGIAFDICITFAHEDGQFAVPLDYEHQLVVIAIAGEGIEKLEGGGWTERNLEGVRIVMFYGEDEEAIAKMMRSLIGPQTTVRNEGFAPGQGPLTDLN